MSILILAVCGFLASTSSAWAYIDPGVGSMALQLIIGGVAAVAATLASFRQRIARVLSSRRD